MAFLKRHFLTIFALLPILQVTALKRIPFLWTSSYLTIQKTSGSCSSGVFRGKCINNIFLDCGQSSPRGLKWHNFTVPKFWYQEIEMNNFANALQLLMQLIWVNLTYWSGHLIVLSISYVIAWGCKTAIIVTSHKSPFKIYTTTLEIVFRQMPVSAECQNHKKNREKYTVS